MVEYFIIDQDTQIDVIEKYFQKTPNTTLFVVVQEKVMGTITNGDYRRSLMRLGVDQMNALEISNKDFVFVQDEGFYDFAADRIFKATFINHLPILNKDRTLNKVITRSDVNLRPMEFDVVFMAGGKGTRLMPLTADIPKPMLKINETPILEILFKQLIAYQFQNFYISVNYKKEIIKDYFKDGRDFGIKISYLEEDEFEGTAASLRMLDHSVSENILVMNGDVLTKLNFDQLAHYHLTNGNDITVALNEKQTDIQYGVVQLSDSNIVGITEKPTLKHFISAGIYIIKSSLLEHMPETGFFDMPDLFNLAIKNNFKIQGYPLTEYWLDIGHVESLKEANISWK